MKTKFAATALILTSSLIASTSFAADTGALTREQVRATVLQARADGSLTLVNEGARIPAKAAPSTLTREAVMAEYFAAKKAGTLYQSVEPGDLLTAEPAFASIRNRAEVRAEAVIAAHTRAQEYGG